MLKRLRTDIVKFCIGVLRKWKSTSIIRKLRFSYELKKRILGENLASMNLDISRMEYELFEKIGLDVFELIKEFGRDNHEEVTVLGAWKNMKYKPSDINDDLGEVVFRYYIYFKREERLVV